MNESTKKFFIIYFITELLVCILSFISGFGNTEFFIWCKIISNILSLPFAPIDWIIKIFRLEYLVLLIGGIILVNEVSSDYWFSR